MSYYLGAEPCRVFLTLEETLRRFEEDLAAEQQEVDEQKSSHGKAKQIKRWRTKQGVVQLKAPAKLAKRNQTLRTRSMQKFFVMYEKMDDGDYTRYTDFLLEENA